MKKKTEALYLLYKISNVEQDENLGSELSHSILRGFNKNKERQAAEYQAKPNDDMDVD